MQDVKALLEQDESEKRPYDDMLNDRNLLVHHGGIYTSKYLRQRTIPLPHEQAVFFHSLQIDSETIFKLAAFLEKIAMKITSGIHARLKKLEGPSEGQIRGKAAEGLAMLFDADYEPVFAKKKV